jgi:O-antigen/teichoic acid export membrane protein
MNKDLLLISAGRLCQIVLALVSVRVFTTLLSASEVGNLYLINSIAAFFGFALLNPVGMYMHRKLNRWAEAGTLLDSFFLYNIYITAISIISVGVVFFLHRILHLGGNVDLTMLLLFVALYIYFNTWNQTIVAVLNLLDHRRSFVVFSLLTALLGLGAGVLLAMWQATAVLWLCGQVAAQIFITLLAFAYLVKIRKLHFNFRRMEAVVGVDNIRNILRFVLPLALTTLLMWTQTQSYRIIVENRIGLEFLGKVGLGLSIAANIAAAVESVVQQTYMPVFYREISGGNAEKRTEACNRMFQLTIPIYLSVTLFVACLAPFLVTLLAHGNFGGAFLFVIYGAWIELFRMITGILSTAAHAEMDTRYLVRSYAAGAVIAVAGVFLGTFSRYYENLIPATLVVSGFLAMVVMYRDTKKIIRVKVGIREIKRSAIMSLPFLAALAFYSHRASLVVSFAVTSILGLYFLGSQYYFYHKRTLNENLT